MPGAYRGGPVEFCEGSLGKPYTSIPKTSGQPELGSEIQR